MFLGLAGENFHLNNNITNHFNWRVIGDAPVKKFARKIF